MLLPVDGVIETSSQYMRDYTYIVPSNICLIKALDLLRIISGRQGNVIDTWWF